MSAFGQVPVSQYNVVLKDRVLFWVQNDDHVRGSHVHTPKPKDISFDPPRITKPRFPAVTQASLRIMLPGIFHVEFDCEKHCRSAGICVHFQFIMGAKRCPDGLVCPRCRKANEEVVIKATRQCPLHYRTSQLKPIGSRPEDFLATAEQLAVCGEILRRSIHNDWADLDQKGKGKVQMRANFDTGESLRGRMQTRDTASDAAARVKREMTPRNIQDVRRTDAARKLSDSGTDDSGYSSWHLSFNEKDPGYMSLRECGGVSYAELQQEMQMEEALMLHGYRKHSVSDMREQDEIKS